MASTTRSIITSGFEFISYRVVDMEIKTIPTLGMLFATTTPEDKWELGLGFSDISFDSENELYIIPLSMTMDLIKIGVMEEMSSTSPYMSAKATISGVFRFAKECTMEKDLRNKMLRQQAPAIILPYLRATISTMLVSAGFGGISIPLMNIYEMAGKSNPVEIIPVTKGDAVVQE